MLFAQPSSQRSENEVRTALLRAFRALSRHGLNAGTAGNASVRCGAGLLVTPSGMPIEQIEERDLVFIDEAGVAHGERAPSSEWRLHKDVLAARADVGAVMHTHSPSATALACHGRSIPAFHYMVLRFGGADIRCAPYATYGTQALSDAVVAALAERTACLMANHGMVVLGKDCEGASAAAIEFESLCDHYWRASLLGAPRLLTAEELAQVQAQFASYGQRSDAASS